MLATQNADSEEWNDEYESMLAELNEKIDEMLDIYTSDADMKEQESLILAQYPAIVVEQYEADCIDFVQSALVKS